MDGRLLGLSIVIFAFAIMETSAQNFYPTRYGKRDGLAMDERWPRASQYERRSDVSGNHFFGSRYGKRSYNTTPPESGKESWVIGAGNRYGRSQDTTNTGDRFFFGSRFGKRSDTFSSNPKVSSESQHLRRKDSLLCRYTGFPHLYHCLEEVDNDKVFEKVL